MKNILSIFVVLAFVGSCKSTQKNDFNISYINPMSGYSQIAEVTAHGTRTLYISGQIADGETKEEQILGAFLAVQNQLSQVGASFKDVVKMNTYIVDYQPKDLASFRNIRKEIMGDSDMPASTLVGVSALALPEWKVEIEAIAVVKND